MMISACPAAAAPPRHNAVTLAISLHLPVLAAPMAVPVRRFDSTHDKCWFPGQPPADEFMHEHPGHTPASASTFARSYSS